MDKALKVLVVVSVFITGCGPDFSGMLGGGKKKVRIWEGWVRPSVVGTNQDYRRSHALTPEGDSWSGSCKIQNTPWWLHKGKGGGEGDEYDDGCLIPGNGALGVSKAPPDYSDVDNYIPWAQWSWYVSYSARTYRVPLPVPSEAVEVTSSGTDSLGHEDWIFAVQEIDHGVAGIRMRITAYAFK